MVDDPEAKVEIAEATEDLRDALHKINHRVEEGVARLRPDRGIRKHPVTTTCIAGALGFALGADSGEVALLGLLLVGATFLISRERHSDHANEVERV
jgi:hypothetical protein